MRLDRAAHRVSAVVKSYRMLGNGEQRCEEVQWDPKVVARAKGSYQERAELRLAMGKETDWKETMTHCVFSSSEKQGSLGHTGL